MLEAEIAAGLDEGLRSLTDAVVGNHTPHLDAEAGVISDDSFEEGDSALFALVRHDLDESDARGIIDADMEELPGGAEMDG